MGKTEEPVEQHRIHSYIEDRKRGDWSFEDSYNSDYGIDDGREVPFIHNRYELAELLAPLYIIEDYQSSYEVYDAFFHRIYNIIKGCFTIQVCREYPVRFKFYRTDEETHTVQLRVFVLCLMAWRPFVELNGIHVLDKEFIINPEVDIPALDDFTNNKIILPLREHQVKSTSVNYATSEVGHLFRSISLIFSDIMGISFGTYDFLEMYKNNPKIRSLMDCGFSDLAQPHDIEKRLDANREALISELKSIPDNGIGIILRSGTGIKHKQLSEFMLAEGLKPSLEGNTIPIAIENSTIRGGLDRPSYLYIDGTGARKSVVTNKRVMGNAGYFGKSLTLLVRTLSMSESVADCGSTHLIPYEIKTKKHLKKLDGKFYKESLEDADYKVLNAKTDTHLIGKTAYFRSIITCCLENEVCPRCIGTTANINEDIGDGIAAFQTEETTKVINQNVLSTKHLLTTDSEEIIFSEGFSDFFTLQSSEIYPIVNNNPIYGDDIGNYGIFISKKDLTKVSELDEDSLYNTQIDTGRLYIRDLRGKEPDRLICTLGKDGEPVDTEIFVSKEASDIMKKHKNVIPFSELDDSTKLFEIAIQNNELTKPLYDMMNLINKRKQIDSETIATIAQKLLDLLIDAGIEATATSSEMIINRMIRDASDIYRRPDFSKKILPKYQIITARQALEKNLAPHIGLSYQDVKRQMISDDMYTKRSESSYLDPLFNTEVPMNNLKEYGKMIDPVYLKEYQEERQKLLYDTTYYNPEYVKSFLEEFARRGVKGL